MKRGLTALVVAAAAFPALAQDTVADWDLDQNPRNRASVASTVLDNGLGLAVRCANNSLEALIVGLPAASGDDPENRPLHIAFGEDPFHHQTWNVGINPTVAVSELPAPFARKLREGGRLQIRVPGAAEGGRNLRYELNLPASSTAIDQVLSNCGRPLVDPRDAELDSLPDLGLPSGVRWAQPPRPEFPLNSRYARGFAVTSCMTTPSGALRNCVVESEHPADAGFGTAALRGIERARTVQDSPDGQFHSVMVVFRSRFVVRGYETPEQVNRNRSRRSR